MRSQKGITLVALILIIVALIILAGISINLVLSNEKKENMKQSTNEVVYNNIAEPSNTAM